MFHNILVSIDGSPHAAQALTEAIDIAVADRSRLTLLTAVRHCPSWAYSPVSAAAAEQLSADFEKEAKQVMCDAVTRVPQEVPVTKILTHKAIRQALLERVKSGEYDLLVMGSRGRGGVKASLLGSVSHYVLNHSPIPVLIVHTPEEQASEETVRQTTTTSEPPGLAGTTPAAPPPPAPA
jgi:nucleotide-binding universal stress UspA family protein